MRIRNNGTATRSYRSYRTNSSSLSGNLEKLSTGYKINRAGDDAAGLAISEKMRSQITGLEGAQQNAKQGIGLIQVTEGALQEYHEILNRMLELSVQSANSTYEDNVDREQLQKEMSRLAQELNRISDSTNFNGTYPLNDGYTPGQDYSADLQGGAAIDVEEAEMVLLSRLTEEGAQSGEVQFSLLWETPQDLDLHCYTPNGGHIHWPSDSRTADGGTLDVDAQFDELMEHPVENIYFKEAPEGDYRVFVRNCSDVAVDQAFVRVKVGDETTFFSLGPIEGQQSYDVTSFSYSKEPPNIRAAENSDNAELISHATLAGSEETQAKHDDKSIRLQIGETADKHNFMNVPRYDMHADKIGLAGVDISAQDSALEAIDKIKTAINNISDVRGTYGALQNRLEHTVNYLGNAQENMQDAESVIRDTDMAAEMMKYTKNNILTQSAQSMLSQANMLPEGVLRLLQG